MLHIKLILDMFSVHKSSLKSDILDETNFMNHTKKYKYFSSINYFLQAFVSKMPSDMKKRWPFVHIAVHKLQNDI